MQKTLSKLLANQTLAIDNHKHEGDFGWTWDNSVHLHKRMNGKLDGASILVNLNNVEVRYRPEKISKKSKEQLRSELQGAFKKPHIRKKFIAEICAFWADITRIPSPITEESIQDIKEPIKRIAKAFGIRQSITNNMIEDSIAFFNFANEQIIAFDANKGERISIGNDKDLVKKFLKSRNRSISQPEFLQIDI